MPRKNIEETREYNRKYYARNKLKFKEYNQNKRRLLTPEQKYKKYLWHKKYNETHKKECNKYATEKRRKNRELLQDIKEHTPCHDCHKHFPYYQMEFDHTDFMGNDKVGGWYSMVGMLAEMMICDLVCSNCHSKRTWLRRQK